MSTGTILRCPVSRMPARQGGLYLVGRTRVQVEGDRYTSAWHLLRWKRWEGKAITPAFAIQEPDAWSFLEPDEEVPACPLKAWERACGFPRPYQIVRRKWAYVARCGAGRGWAVREVTYGVPDCKKCLARLGSGGEARRRG